MFTCSSTYSFNPILMILTINLSKLIFVSIYSHMQISNSVLLRHGVCSLLAIVIFDTVHAICVVEQTDDFLPSGESRYVLQ